MPSAGTRERLAVAEQPVVPPRRGQPSSMRRSVVVAPRSTRGARDDARRSPRRGQAPAHVEQVMGSRRRERDTRRARASAVAVVATSMSFLVDQLCAAATAPSIRPRPPSLLDALSRPPPGARSDGPTRRSDATASEAESLVRRLSGGRWCARRRPRRRGRRRRAGARRSRTRRRPGSPRSSASSRSGSLRSRPADVEDREAVVGDEAGAGGGAAAERAHAPGHERRRHRQHGERDGRRAAAQRSPRRGAPPACSRRRCRRRAPRRSPPPSPGRAPRRRP